jgi:putative iron-dependent peroxidase
MATPQPGIVMEENAAGLFLVLRAKRDVNARALIKGCAQAAALTAALRRRYPKAALRCTVAFGRGLLTHGVGWPKLPARLTDLKPIHTKAGDVPRTPADVLFHIGSARHDLNFALAEALLAAIGERAAVVEEIAGFRYLDTRDLTGFIDGTANPKGRERAAAALIGAEDRRFAGGSYVLIQRYVHNLEAWSRLSQARQESAIGRTKKNSIELAGKQKLSTAHISRAEITGPDGEERKIVRHSMPYGLAGGDKGLFFIAYAKDPAIFQTMLTRMFGASDDGLSDRLVAFTKPVTGAILFAPSRATLGRLSR